LAVIPGTLALTLTTYAPTIAIDYRAVPPTLALVLTTYASTVLTPRLVTPSTLALTLTTYAPVFGIGVIPSTLALILTTYAPTITTPIWGLAGHIAFGSDPYSDTPTWSSISADLIAIFIKRGRQHQLDRFEAGTATVLLNNADGNYWPDNGAGDYSPNVKIGKRIIIRAGYDGVSYDLYTGFIRRYKPLWLSDKGLLHPVMQLEIADLQRNLARTKVTDAGGYAEEASGTRIGNVLDDADWNATERDIDTGKETMVASGALANEILMEHIQKVQESELSTFWIRGDGYTVYQERGALTAVATSGIFGDAQLPIDSIEFSLDDDLLYNEVRLNRIGGTEQSHTDAASIIAYGLRTLSRSDLFLTADVTVLALVLYLLARYKDAVMRVKSITVKPQSPADTATLWPLMLGIDIGHKITLTLARAHIDADYFIEGIEHNWDYRVGEWTTKLQLSEAAQYYNDLDARDETIRPNGAGAVTELDAVGDSPNWECVDEEVADGDTTYVTYKPTVGSGKDLYALANPTYPYGTINKVTVYFRMKLSNQPGNISQDVIVKTEGVEYPTSYYTTSGYSTYSIEYALNPNTSLAWTWAQVNALQLGVELTYITAGAGYEGRCTQVYAVVNYTPTW